MGAIRRLAASALLLVVCFGTRARAVDLHDVLADYALTSWSQKDGLPGAVWAIAQDRDNYLWLGTDGGLVRFDGVRFVPWRSIGTDPLPRQSIRALWASRDGSLWVGYETGGVSQIRDGRVSSQGQAQGLTDAYVSAFAEDRSNTLWAASLAGLFRREASGWRRVGADDGLTDGPVFTVHVDEKGTVFAATATQLFQREERADRFHAIQTSPDFVRSVSVGPHGHVWATDPTSGFARVDHGAPQPVGAAVGRGVRLLHDGQGNLWVGTLGQGLWRVRLSGDNSDAAVIERASVLTGLSSDTVRSLIEDREGNIWAGTSEGLNRLTRHRVTPVLTLGMITGLDATRDGRVWVATADALMRFSETNGWWQTDGAEWAVGGARMLHVDANGTPWFAVNNTLMRLSNNRIVRVPLPAKGGPSRIDGIDSDPHGRIWLVDRVRGVFRWDGTRLEAFNPAEATRPGWITSVYADRSGRLWLTMTGNRVGVLDLDGRFQFFGPQDGLAAGPYNAVYEDSNRIIWIGSGDGLSWYAGGHFASVSRAKGFPFDGITSIVEDDERQLWLGTAAGIVRLSRGEFEAAIEDPQHQVRYRLYDSSDGVAGLPLVLGSRGAVRASDGRLWFATGRGLTVVDPRLDQERRPPVPARIEGATAADRRIAAVDGAELPPEANRLAIEYTAVSLTAPFKTRFRYRLDGFDADWIDAGTRREAVYTNLPPRRYRFRVATMADGVGSASEAAWDFTIEPRFYQTASFYVMLLVAAFVVVAGAWQLRLRQIRRQFGLVLGERVRLSRELHDTLLQSLIGVALQVDAVSTRMESSPTGAKADLARVRRQVEEYIREARQSIWNLRSPSSSTPDLAAALKESGERTTAGTDIAFDFDVVGTPRRYPADAEHQLLRIGQEAVLNAVRHAGAEVVRLELRYDDDALTLRVQDAGCGFDPDVAGNGLHAHYGLTTMRERAEEAGGRLDLRTAPGSGTIVEVTVPAPEGREAWS